MYHRLLVYEREFWTKKDKKALLSWPWHYVDNFALNFSKEIGQQLREKIEDLEENHIILTEGQFLLLVCK
jgi:hypothetical protein